MNAVSFDRALALLESVAGADALRIVDAGKSTRAGDQWVLRSAAGVDVAECNVRHHVCVCHFLPGVQRGIDAVTATVQTTRVTCDSCRHPRVLPGRAVSGTSYVCNHCGRTCFVR